MLDNKKIKYICFGLAIIIIILFVSLIFKNLTTKREGYENENPALSNIEELPGKIKGALSNIESSLLLSNNKSNYEDIIIGLNDSIDVQILNIFKKKGEYYVKASGLQGSNILSSLATANCYIKLGMGIENIKESEIVTTIPFEVSHE